MDTELADTEIFFLKQSLDLPSLEIPSLFLQSPNLLTTAQKAFPPVATLVFPITPSKK